MIIIKDTREKNGWDFSIYDGCKDVIVKGLKTGDYTLSGLEKELCIERKATTGEISFNLGRKRNQFEAEMERMANFRWAYLICEFSVDDILNFPENSGIPRCRWHLTKIRGKYMYKLLNEFAEKYGVQMFFMGDKFSAYNKAIEIFETVWEVKQGERQY